MAKKKSNQEADQIPCQSSPQGVCVEIYLVCRLEGLKFLTVHSRRFFKRLAAHIRGKQAVFLSYRRAQEGVRFSGPKAHIVKAWVPEHSIIGLYETLYVNEIKLLEQQIHGCYLGERHQHRYLLNPKFVTHQ